MNWKDLNNATQLAHIKEHSHTTPIIIFKHSTRCSISNMAKGRLERNFSPSEIEFYYLDLLQHRNISAMIAEQFNVHHESPQVLLIKNGECVYDESHNGIDMQEIMEQAGK